MAGKQSKAQKAQAKRAEANKSKSLLKVKPRTATSSTSSINPDPNSKEKHANSISMVNGRRRTAEAEESSFSKLTSHQLEQFNLSAHYSILKRPIPSSKAVFDQIDLRTSTTSSIHIQEQEESIGLSLPKKPRWKNVADTKALHANEKEVFKQWLISTDQKLYKAFSATTNSLESTDSTSSSDPIPNQTGFQVLPSLETDPSKAIIPTLYERNLEVFRQLWRVVERSDVVCVLLDIRCPPLHLPFSLQEYLLRFAKLKTILILTKCDLVNEGIVKSWKDWLQNKYPNWKVVVTESYVRKEKLEGQGSRIRQAPHISPKSKTSFFEAVKECHRELSTPPIAVASDPERLESWRAPCITQVDWSKVEVEGVEIPNTENQPGMSVEDKAKAREEKKERSEGQEGQWRIPDYLTIGLIGQPNVGKSSLLNALVGSKVVRASKTAGKTKHFQTHHLSKQVRLCDSPGLVFPSLIGLEMQVLGNILPISQVQAITSVVRFVGARLNLEKVLDLKHDEDELELQRNKKEEEKVKGRELYGDGSWTALKILEALASRYNYKTAKANRYDTNRAGNGLIRALAEGRIRWAFRPPNISEKENEEGEDRVGMIGDDYSDAKIRDGEGIWLGEIEDLEGKVGSEIVRKDALIEESEDEDDEDEVEKRLGESKSSKEVRFDEEVKGGLDRESNTEEEEDDEEEVEEPRQGIKTAASMFAALGVQEGESEEETESEEEEES